MKLKNALLTGLSFALVATVSVGGTLAYLTSTDDDVNVMTLGNVSIAQYEYERVVDENGNPVKGVEGTDFDANYGITESYKLQEFTQAKPAFPAVYQNGGMGWDAFQQLWNGVGAPGSNELFDTSMKNVVDKFVFVENTGTTDAYYRTVIAVEAPEGVGENLIHLNMNSNSRFDYNVDVDGAQNSANSNKFYTTIDGVRYLVYTATHTEILKPGAVSRPSLLQLYLDPAVTNEDCAKFGNTWDVLVLSQAVQAHGFQDAAAALEEGFGAVNAANVAAWFGNVAVPALVADEDELKDAMNEGKDVFLGADLEDVAVGTDAPYGNYYGLKQSGNTLDGTGKTLDFDLGTMKNGKFDNYGIMTSGGTIRNVTVSGVFRGIVIMDPTEDLYLDNVTVGGDEDMCYGINTAEGNGQHNVYISNSKISGWNSFGTAINDLYFTNCTFGQGTYYTDVFGRLVKPYVDTVFENCEFGNKYYIDLSALESGKTVTLRNCTVNGVKLTAQNWKDLIVSESECVDGQISVELRNGTYLSASNVADYVIIE